MDFLRLGVAIREARKARHLTQIILKDAVSCSQSQISELEQGIPNAVSREALGRIADYLGLKLEAFEEPEVPAEVESSGYLYCGNQACPAARPFYYPGGIRVKPHFLIFVPGIKVCEFCGEPLTSHCRCGLPVHPGFLCRRCSEPYIEAAPGLLKKSKSEIETLGREVDLFVGRFEPR